MRKLSTILRIGQAFHYPTTGDIAHTEYMCYAFDAAEEAGLLTTAEVSVGKDACRCLVDSLSSKRVSLYAAVGDLVLKPGKVYALGAIDRICAMIYCAWIDKLESQDL